MSKKMIGARIDDGLEERIRAAAKLERRGQSDWIRIKLDDAATETLARHQPSQAA